MIPPGRGEKGGGERGKEPLVKKVSSHKNPKEQGGVRVPYKSFNGVTSALAQLKKGAHLK